LATEQIIRALKRVPGVLTVEADAGGASALVAHDAAVPLTSLVAAASMAGAAAKVVGEVGGLPASTATTLLPKSTNQVHLRGVAIAAIVAVIIIDMTFPNSPEKRWLFLLPLAVLWAFVVFKELAGRRR
jgi:copper chaperone CopZ